ncbi:MAG: caffeoyl-CoA O-methyltransferase [Thermoproteota archaeon]|jgi:caffeoyl-CoA O-methyltransferase
MNPRKILQKPLSEIYSQLHEYAQTCSINSSDDYSELVSYLDNNRLELNFPAVNNDVGMFLSNLVEWTKPKRIFEFGSGYGHSAFWYLLSDHSNLEKVYLTERRTDLLDIFNKAPWPKQYKDKCIFYQGDAFNLLAGTDEFNEIDLVLIDGQKSSYLDFIKLMIPRLSDGGIIVVDNAFWRGSFLDEEFEGNLSAQKIKELHEFVAALSGFKSSFLPFIDGVITLTKES